ncbi:MAG: hypothetical protein LBK63_12670 [Treponema sp.]|jgi:hypothetical protein|nr:hypothetical protein [Treponema sp.]
MGYAWAARLARKSINKNGTKAVLRIPTGESVWDDDSAAWIDVYEEHQGLCLVSSYTQEDLRNTLIEAGDRKLLCVFPIEPKPKVSLVDVYKKTGALDATYSVENYSALIPDASTIILYQIQGRS